MTIDKFEDAPYRNHEPEFTDIEGSVKYIDGSSLARPFELPLKSYALAGVFIIVAALIGAFMLAKYRRRLRRTCSSGADGRRQPRARRELRHPQPHDVYGKRRQRD